MSEWLLHTTSCFIDHLSVLMLHPADRWLRSLSAVIPGEAWLGLKVTEWVIFYLSFFSFWLRERDGAVDPPRAALTTSPPAQTGPTCPCCCSGWTPEQRAGLRGAAAAWATRVKFGREPASKPEVNLRHLHNKSTKDFVILKSITIILNRKIKKQILLHTQRWVEWIEYKKLLK